MTHIDETSTLMLEDRHSSGVYIKRDLTIVRGEGAYVFDDMGRAYIDCVSGQGASNLGHAHPAIVAAIESQCHQLMVCPEFLHTPTRAQYQAALCAATQMDRVFLCNSGAEAIEAALKFARVLTGRRHIVSTMRAFHGRTMGALSTTWNKAYREPFEPLIGDVDFVPFNNTERMISAITPNTAAVILELVQGEGGIHPAEIEYVQAVEKTCRSMGALLIIDEIQTGFGRIGSLFAFQQYGIRADLLCLAKSIANGLPMGAVLLRTGLPSLPPASHGSTFGGNPLACAVGLAVLQTLQTTDLIKRARERGAEVLAYLNENLSSQVVREVRGRGFMIGIELRQKVAPILQALGNEGVLALSAGPTVLRLLPPLIIDDETLWQAIEIVTRTVNNATR
ncbi:MAG: aspartate aminotransferase family protein [Phototrophicales bacterium]|nr:MAG: aspartate aminotransferase family protein [Phototrophicales bacterium]